MTKKGLVEDAKHKLVDAAKVGAEGVKTVGSEALTAAATAAAGVVLERVSQALGAGQQKVEEIIPPTQQALRDASETKVRTRRSSVPKKRQAAKSRSGSSSAKKAVKKAAKKAVKKARAPKQRPKSSRSKKSVNLKRSSRKNAGTRKRAASRRR